LVGALVTQVQGEYYHFLYMHDWDTKYIWCMSSQKFSDIALHYIIYFLFIVLKFHADVNCIHIFHLWR
jgi:hypothetical protein